MTIRLLAFGIAKDILQARTRSFELSDESTIAGLKTALIVEFPDLSGLQRLSFAVNESYVKDNFILNEGDEVVLIPPVSGG
jgi:molybdopterin converting factor subunit 1